VECVGGESSILDCPANDIGVNNCGHSEDVGVICGAAAAVVPVRLAGGSGPHEGRLEVNVDGVWGTVCDDWFETVDAQVVCAQLGLSGGAVGDFGEGEGPILMDNVECVGDELSVLDCQHHGEGQDNCGHFEDVGVICDAAVETEDTPVDGSVRLADGDAGAGRVEIFYEGQWGTVCDDDWDDVDASVVCRSLGYSSGIALEDCEYGEGEGQIWLDEVDCVGDESQLMFCSASPPGLHDCSHYEDAGVICS